MKKYDSYKDSGIEWIGDIPSHWDFYNLKFILREGVKDGPHETPIWFEEGIPFLSIDGIVNGEISFEKCRYIDEQQFEQFSKKLIIEKDDIFIGKAASIGKIARVKTDRKFTVWSPIAVIKVKKEFNPTFVEYYFRSDVVQHQIELLSTSNTQKNIAMGDIPKMKFIAPTEEEQTVIAKYLDHKTTQIDQLIAKKEQFIQLLEEERVAVINQAVTKGLDPNVPMKDSGIEWLGEIPAHWEVKRLRNIVDTVKTGSTPPSDEIQYFEPQEINWYGPGDFDKLKLGDAKRKISQLAIEQNKCRLFPSNSILLIGIGATVGKVGLATEPCSSNQQINAIILKEFYNARFYLYFLSTIKEIIVMEASSATLPIFNQTQTKNISVSVPPIEEQNKIVDFIENQMERVQTIIEKSKHEIELLKEYKTALISEVVTGKVDVREEKIN